MHCRLGTRALALSRLACWQCREDDHATEGGAISAYPLRGGSWMVATITLHGLAATPNNPPGCRLKCRPRLSGTQDRAYSTPSPLLASALSAAPVVSWFAFPLAASAGLGAICSPGCACGSRATG